LYQKFKNEDDFMPEKSTRLYMRVTPQQKKKVAQIAERCGLPQSEYIRQRALGYTPRTVLPDAFYNFNVKLSELCNSIDGKVSAETEEKLLNLINEIQLELLLPGKETVKKIKAGLEEDKVWQPQDSGPSKEN
jgi:hypothetical protein